jgi:hypothetical protein
MKKSEKRLGAYARERGANFDGLARLLARAQEFDAVIVDAMWVT